MFDTAWVLGMDGALEALALRRAVFVDELGFDEAAIFDEGDAMGAHLIVREDGRLIASGRMRPANGGVSLDHICVAAPYRGQGYGDLCTRVMLDKARRMGVAKVGVRVSAEQAPYYARFGFQADGASAGNCVSLSIAPEDIDWHPACGD